MDAREILFIMERLATDDYEAAIIRRVRYALEDINEDKWNNMSDSDKEKFVSSYM